MSTPWSIYLFYVIYFAIIIFISEAAIRGVLWKKVFLEISLNSQENTCVKVSFLIKLLASGLQHY